MHNFSAVLKCITMVPRPIGVEGIRTIRAETATGYSFPSTHTATFTIFLNSLATIKKNKKLRIFALILPLFIGFSRIYLGCHWLSDVIGGYAIGIIFPIFLYWLFNRFKNNKNLLFLVSALIFVPFCFILTGYLLDFIKVLGLLFGFGFGSFIEEKYISFSTEISVKKKILRLVIGLLSVVASYFVGKIILPDTGIFAFIRYSIISFDAVAIAPFLFKKLKI